MRSFPVQIGLSLFCALALSGCPSSGGTDDGGEPPINDELGPPRDLTKGPADLLPHASTDMAINQSTDGYIEPNIAIVRPEAGSFIKSAFFIQADIRDSHGIKDES